MIYVVKQDNEYKLLTGKTSTTYYKDGEFKTPTLSANGTMGGNNYAVSSNAGTAWHAIASRTYNGKYITKYANEKSSTMYFYIYTPKPTIVTDYGFYIHTVNSDMNWGNIKSSTFGGRTAAESSYTNFKTVSGLARDKYLSYNIPNNTKECQYYRLSLTTHGSGHKDRSSLSCFWMSGTSGMIIGSEEDYTYANEQQELLGFKRGFIKWN